MKLIERYVHDVARRLPQKQRRDVAMELTTEIEEMAKGRNKAGRLIKQHVYDVLMELGSPSKLADQYREHPRYLIGPEYFESYITLLKSIYIIVLPLLLFITWMSESLTQNHTFVSILLSLIGMSVEISVHLFFWSTLSFLFAQKVAGMKPYDEDWTPDSLPTLPAEREITRNESYFAIAWSVFAVLATLFQIPVIFEWLGPDDVPQFFSEAMWPQWTLGLLALSLLGLLTEIIKLAVRGWTTMTVALVSIVNIITITFFVSLVTLVEPIANPDLMKLIAGSLDRPDIAGTVHTGIIVFVYIVVAISIWEVAEAVYKYKKGGNK